VNGPTEPFMRVSKVGVVVVALVGLLTSARLLAPPVVSYETPDTLPKELVKGPRWEVQSPVVSDGYFFRSKIKSEYGPFEVTGVGALRKLVVEIGAIAQLKEIKASKAFTTAVADSATGPFRFAKNLILHPADTLSGVPKGAYKLVEADARRRVEILD
jgi:hypothetical protein